MVAETGLHSPQTTSQTTTPFSIRLFGDSGSDPQDSAYRVHYLIVGCRCCYVELPGVFIHRLLRSRYTSCSHQTHAITHQAPPTSEGIIIQMEPDRNSALQNAKLQTILQLHAALRSESSSRAEMTAPPAYHTVVDPTMPIPNMRNPYDLDEEEDEKDEDDTPEITINAATQVRGHGNIISTAQMDSMRIATLLASILNGKIPEPGIPLQQPHTSPSMAAPPPGDRSKRVFPRINITVNCGATVVGDRNIVGPGLGEVARQMQISQRNQAMQTQQQQAQSQQTSPPVKQSESPTSEAQAATPPMSRSPSLQRETSNGAKRKAEDAQDGNAGKRQC